MKIKIKKGLKWIKFIKKWMFVVQINIYNYQVNINKIINYILSFIKYKYFTYYIFENEVCFILTKKILLKNIWPSGYAVIIWPKSELINRENIELVFSYKRRFYGTD